MQRRTDVLSGRHRPLLFDATPTRPAALTAAYRLAHPGRLRTIGRRETRAEREKLARRTAARDRFLADANRGVGHAAVATA